MNRPTLTDTSETWADLITPFVDESPRVLEGRRKTKLSELGWAYLSLMIVIACAVIGGLLK